MSLILPLQTRWAALSASEQRTLKLGAAVVVPVLFYLLLWQPAHDGVARLKTTVPAMRAQLAQMQAQAIEVQTLRQGAHPALSEGDALLGIVRVASEAAGWVAPAMTLELADKSNVRISAESVEFSRWIKFLHELETTHHIRVNSLSVSAAPTQGMIKVNAVLTNGAQE